MNKPHVNGMKKIPLRNIFWKNCYCCFPKLRNMIFVQKTTFQRMSAPSESSSWRDEFTWFLVQSHSSRNPETTTNDLNHLSLVLHRELHACLYVLINRENGSKYPFFVITAYMYNLLFAILAVDYILYQKDGSTYKSAVMPGNYPNELNPNARWADHQIRYRNSVDLSRWVIRKGRKPLCQKPRNTFPAIRPFSGLSAAIFPPLESLQGAWLRQHDLQRWCQ